MEINTNLRDKENVEFKEKVILGEIKAEDLVNMDGFEMINKKKMDDINKAKVQAADSMRSDWAETHLDIKEGVYQCRKCKGRKTTQFELQTRSADEPMTMFIKCITCGNQWKL